MAAPQYVSSTLAEQPRRGLALPPSDGWRADRPAELGPSQPVGPGLGRQGPDQGFALALVHQFDGRLVVPAPEKHEDVVAGCLGVALARASLFGRAPVVHDLDIAFRIWGYLGDAPAGLLALRRPLFEAASHNYDDQRAIVDRVPESTLRLAHGEVASRYPAEWQTLVAST